MAERLGAQLVRKGLIQGWQLEDALKVQQEYGCRLGTNLIELEFIDVDTLAENLGEQRKYPVAKPSDFESAPSTLLPLIPEKLADQHLAFPLAQDGRKLKVAFAAPYEPLGLDAIQFATGLRIVPYIAPEVRIFFYLDRRYGIVRPTRYIRRPARNAPPAPSTVAPPPPSISGGNGLFGSLKTGEFLSAEAETNAFDPGSVPRTANGPPGSVPPPRTNAPTAAPAAQNPKSSPVLNPVAVGSSANPPAPLAPPAAGNARGIMGNGHAEPMKGVADTTSSWGEAIAVGQSIPAARKPSAPPSIERPVTSPNGAIASAGENGRHAFAYLPPEGVVVAEPDGDSDEQLPTLDLEAEEESPEPQAVEPQLPEPRPLELEPPEQQPLESQSPEPQPPELQPRSFDPIPIPEAPAANEAMTLAPAWEFVSWHSGGESAAAADRPMIPVPDESPGPDVPLASALESVKWQPNMPGLQTVATFWEMCAGCRAAEQIAMATLEYCSKRFSRGAYLVSRFGLAVLWQGFNLGESGIRPDTLRVDLNAPSIVRAAHDGGVAVASPTPQTPMDQWIWQALMPQNGLVVVKLAFNGNVDYLCVEIGARSMVDVQQELMEVQHIAVEAQCRLASSNSSAN